MTGMTPERLAEEPHPGPEHVREYRDDKDRVVYVNVDNRGLVVCTAKVVDMLLTEIGYSRTDGYE